eukprot:448027_1
MATEFKENKHEIHQSILGVHCTSYDCATVPNHSYYIDIPIGSQIARWDIKNNKRINTFYVHDACISSVKPFIDSSKHMIATSSFDQTLKIWNNKYQLLCQYKFNQIARSSRIEWNNDGTQLVVVTVPDGICLFNLNYDENHNEFSLKMVSDKSDNYRYATFNQNSQILAIRSNPNIIELLNKDEMKFIKSYTQSIKETWNCAVSINDKRDKIAIGTTNKQIIILDTLNLEIINVIKSNEIAPNLWCILWSKTNANDIIFSPKNGEIQVWDTIKCQHKYCVPTFFGFMYVLQHSNEKDYIWMATSDSIFYQSIANPSFDIDIKENNELKEHGIQKKSRLSLQFHTISCCGVDFSFNNNGISEYIAVGDLGCCLCIWNNNYDLNIKNGYNPLIKKQCIMSIRSIKWIPQTNIIFIG